MNRSLYFATVLLTALISCSQPYEPVEVDKGPITVELVDQIIETGSESAVVDILNRAKEEAVVNEELADYLIDLWESELTLEPRIRVVLADVVSQLTLNGIVQTDARAIHEYLRESILSSSDATVRRRATSALAMFDSIEDVAILEDLASNGDPVIMRSAVGALAAMCNDEADRALIRLSDSDDQDVGEFASRTKLEFDAYEQDSGWCDR